MSVYTKEHHQRAFSAWRTHRSISAVARLLGASRPTIYSWRRPEFSCRESCGFHGWDALLAKKDSALIARKALVDAGVRDHKLHDQAILATLGSSPRAEAVLQAVRSDLKRLQRLELLYARVFFDMTGQVIPPFSSEAQIDPPPGLDSDLLRLGLHVTSLEAGVRALSLILSEIRSLEAPRRSVQPKPRFDLQQLRKLLEEQTPGHFSPLDASATHTLNEGSSSGV